VQIEHWTNCCEYVNEHMLIKAGIFFHTFFLIIAVSEIPASEYKIII